MLSKFEFKNLKTKTNMRVKRRIIKGTQLCLQSNPFESVFLFTKVPDNAEVGVMLKGTKVESIREGMWFGVVELMEYERVAMKNKGKQAKDLYQALASVLNLASLEIISVEDQPVEFIEMDVDCIQDIRRHSDMGTKYINALRTLWL